MDLTTLYFTLYELLLSIVFGLLTIFVCLKSINLTFLKSEGEDLLLKPNAAISLFAGAIIISVLLLVHASVLPSIDALRAMVLGGRELDMEILLISFGYFMVFYIITLVISLGVVFLAVQIYMAATINIDEMAEVKKNNIAVAILLSAVLLSMSIFIQPAANRFIASLVNYESLQSVKKPISAYTPPTDKMISPRPGKTYE